MNVRIPPTPERFEYLCVQFTRSQALALANGDDWPVDLDAWSERLEASAAGSDAHRG